MACPKCGNWRIATAEEYLQNNKEKGWILDLGAGSGDFIVANYCYECGTELTTDTNSPENINLQEDVRESSNLALKDKALKCIDFICLMEARVDDKAMDNIYKFAHCVDDHSSCYDVHSEWRQELEKYYQSLVDAGQLTEKLPKCEEGNDD